DRGFGSGIGFAVVGGGSAHRTSHGPRNPVHPPPSRSFGSRGDPAVAPGPRGSSSQSRRHLRGGGGLRTGPHAPPSQPERIPSRAAGTSRCSSSHASRIEPEVVAVRVPRVPDPVL